MDFRFLFFNNTVLFVSCIDLTDVYWVPSVSGRYARVPSIIRCGPHLGRAYSLTMVRERKKQADGVGGQKWDRDKRYQRGCKWKEKLVMEYRNSTRTVLLFLWTCSPISKGGGQVRNTQEGSVATCQRCVGVPRAAFWGGCCAAVHHVCLLARE